MKALDVATQVRTYLSESTNVVVIFGEDSVKQLLDDINSKVCTVFIVILRIDGDDDERYMS